MPILHVRNVPDDLYEHICRQAREQNRSISAQVIYLLERAVLESPQAQRIELDLLNDWLSIQPGQQLNQSGLGVGAAIA